MSECRICREHGFPGIMIAWDNNIKTKTGRFVPLELDKTTPHKHYESATANNDKNDNNDNDTSLPSKTTTKPDVDVVNLAMIKVIAAALNEYIAIKEVKKDYWA